MLLLPPRIWFVPVILRVRFLFVFWEHKERVESACTLIRVSAKVATLGTRSQSFRAQMSEEDDRKAAL